MALDKQIHIYSVDTGAFYTRKENILHWKLSKLRDEKEKVKNVINSIEYQLALYGIVDKNIDRFYEDNENISRFINDEYCLISYLISKREFYLDIKSKKSEKIKETKNKLLHMFETRVEKNKDTSTRFVRKLNPKQTIDKNVISVFESALTRTLQLKTNELTTDIVIVKTFYFDVIKDLILHGFEFNGEKYKYLTSSAGQIRTKKTVFIKKTLWDLHEKSLMCGLTIESINNSGGININKYLAYLALTNSATDTWDGFDIDKTVVVSDFETTVTGLVDFIDDENYTIERKLMPVPIPHTDGCGMILPSLSSKNFMVRLPWVKGLLAVFDFRKFIESNVNSTGIVKDIYGIEHDIIKEDIQIIFTESQFKMYKFYKNWDEYKEFFKEYNCLAGKCNVEEDRIPNAKINYQMLQTLTDITPLEIQKLSQKSNNKIINLTSTVRSMMDVFGVTEYNINKTALQKSIEIYPEILNDNYTKIIITEIKNSLIQSYRAGKLEINGKYTFLIPDLYAFCEKLFLHNDNPIGILKDGEVSCRLYKKIEKLDCLRSPHLYREHAVRNNVVNDITDEWFITDAIYTSCHDIISKILMFDVDGDRSLVVADKLLVDIAERNMKNIVPLYYNMRKALPVTVSNNEIYNGLNAAYSGGNIGVISNDISKIWNSNVWFSEDKEIQEEALSVIKFLCMDNNFCIDYAKTLYKPTPPEHIKKLIRKYTKEKLPHFFTYAKDKKEENVELINDSVVNRLNNIIKNKRLSFKLSEFGKMDYRMLMNNPNIKIDESLIKLYRKLNTQYHYKINMEDKYTSNIGYIAKLITDELSTSGYSDIEIVDMLVKHLYHKTNSKSKEALWFCYGDIIFENLQRNIGDKDSICLKCGKRFKKNSPNQEYCDECGHTYEKIKKKKVACVDCGKEVIIDAWDMKTCRCKVCQKERDRERKRIWKSNNKIK